MLIYDNAYGDDDICEVSNCPLAMAYIQKNDQMPRGHSALSMTRVHFSRSGNNGQEMITYQEI